MGEWIDTAVRCDNPEVLRQCAILFSERDDDVRLEEGVPEIGTTMLDYVPIEEIKSVSTIFPDDLIICEYSDEPDGYIDSHMIVIQNGDSHIIPPNDYSLTIVPVESRIDRISISSRATNFFCRLDPEERDKDGNLSRNWFPEKVTYEFDCVGEDGTTVRVVATKCGRKIGFEVYDAKIRYRLVEC